MKLDLYKCDWCSRDFEYDDIISLTFVVGREMDASGNGYEDTKKYKDMCKNCAKDTIEKLLAYSE